MHPATALVYILVAGTVKFIFNPVYALSCLAPLAGAAQIAVCFGGTGAMLALGNKSKRLADAALGFFLAGNLFAYISGWHL